MAPSSVATASTSASAERSPETTTFPGQSMLAFQSRPWLETRSQSSSILASSSPSTLVIPLGDAKAAACMAWPRSRTTRRPASKSRAPANTRAVYSPRLNPAAPWHWLTTSGCSALSASSAARLATKMAGWLISVASSKFAGPSKQRARRSSPRISLARSNSERTEGYWLSSSRAMPTVWAPCPGNKKPIFDMRGSVKREPEHAP